MSQKINVGIVGATGAVGEVFMDLLQERRFPTGELRLFASDRSKGSTLHFSGRDIVLQTLQAGCFDGLDLVFFSSGDDISKEWAPLAVKAGAYAVDNSAAFRMDEDKLLVVPEVNGHLLPKWKGSRVNPALIANPNCSTIQLVVALAPLLRDFGLESVHVATYQAVSGAGKAGQDELKAQLASWLGQQGTLSNTHGGSPGYGAAHAATVVQTFPHPIAMNCIPQIGSFQDSGFCSEELKIVRETKKIFGDTSFRVSAFTTRVPVWNAHSEAVWVRLKKRVTREEILGSLHTQSGLTVEPEFKKPVYPLARDLSGKDGVAVGRIHQDLDDPQTWILWIVSDNVRKGAATNGIQIAERILT